MPSIDQDNALLLVAGVPLALCVAVIVVIFILSWWK